MGTHGVSGFQEFMVGSNASRVMSASSCPVFTVQKHSDRVGYKNIVLPIDDSKHSREKVNFAIGLAQQYNAKIHLVAFNMDGSKETLSKLTLQVNQLEEIFKKADVFFTTKIEETDDNAQSVLEYCDEVDADVMIIMTEQEFDLKGVLFGPAAQRLVNHSKVPVISIRPHYNPEMIDFHGYGW
jgi:nucleotide-binding universal stress UspA family protein